MEPAVWTRRRSVSAPARAALAAALAVAFALVAVAPFAVGSASATDPARAVADARRAVDRLANQYFAAVRHLDDLNSELAVIDAHLAGARRAANATRAVAAARAATLYRSAGLDALTGDPSGSTLVAARRLQLFDSANEVAQQDIDRYTAASADLQRARADLERARAAQRDQIKQLDAERATLDARLATVQQAYRAELAARHQAEVIAARSLAARRPTSAAPNTATTAPATTTTGGTPAPAPTPAPPPPQSGTFPHHNDPFLACVRQRESNGYYGAVSPNGYYGAYQFSPSTWDVTASHAGRVALVGVRPDQASAWDQDDMAWTLYQWQGAAPWGGHCP